jgi:hypothetical protein
MELQDGKLYETHDRRRFRVTEDKETGRFVCRRSFYGFWDRNGRASTIYTDGLVREVEETRWVPAVGFNKSEQLKDGKIYRIYRGHWQEQVSRDEARRRAPNYKPSTKSEPDTRTVSGHVLSPKEGAWFNWSFSTENGVTYLDIETSKGARLTFPL